MKRSSLSLLSLAALATVFAFATGADARSKGHGFDHLTAMEHRVSGLDVDAETLDAIYAELDAARDSQRGLRQEMRSAHERMRSLLEQEVPVVEEVMAQADVLGALAGEARKAGLRTYLRILALVPEDQRDVLRERGRGKHPGRHRDEGFDEETPEPL